MNKGLKISNKLKIIVNLIIKCFDYIYDFLFDWEEDESYEEKKFIENEKLKHVPKKETAPKIEKNATVSIHNAEFDANKKDYNDLKLAFGVKTADYIVKSRNEVDFLKKEHGLVHENSLIIVLNPEKIRESLSGLGLFETTIERLYSQYDKDVIFKPGNIRITRTSPESFYAEIQIESYTVTENLLSTV